MSEQGRACDVLRAHGSIWHIYDTTSPFNRTGWTSDGYQIISSLLRKMQTELKAIQQIKTNIFVVYWT